MSVRSVSPDVSTPEEQSPDVHRPMLRPEHGWFLSAIGVGAINMILLKVIFSAHSNEAPFEKPMFAGMLVMFGSSLGIPLHMLLLRYNKKQRDTRSVWPAHSLQPMVCFIALLDLTAGIMCNFGVGPLDVSIFAMVRSSVAVTSALLRGLVLSKWPTRHGKYGVACILVGIALAAEAATSSVSSSASSGMLGSTSSAGITSSVPSSASSVMSGSTSSAVIGFQAKVAHNQSEWSTHWFLRGRRQVPSVGARGFQALGCKSSICGLLCVIAGCFIRSVQFVTEERLLDRNTIAPMMLVGLTGVWGMAWYLPLAFLAQAVQIEDTRETLERLLKEPVFCVLLFVYSLTQCGAWHTCMR